MSIIDDFGIKIPTELSLGGGTKKVGYKGHALPYITNDQAIDSAMKTIDAERAGEQLGLYSPFPGVDKLQGKYWRFAQTNIIASLTSHGKSYTLLQLVNCWSEFEDREVARGLVPLNPDERIDAELKFQEEGINFITKPYKDTAGKFDQPREMYYELSIARNKKFATDGNKVIFLNFYFEMRGEDDITRNVSILTGKSVSHLYSSEYDDKEAKYNNLSEAEYNKIKYTANKLKGRPIYYFEVSGSVNQIHATYKFWKQANPHCKFVINIDHIGLIDEDDYQNETGVMKAIGKTSIKFRRESCMTNLICQMNTNILDSTRQAKPATQHPVAPDIHGSKQVGWAVDNIWFFPYRPEVEKLPRYGVNQMDTKGLVIAAKVKSRNGSTGEVYFENQLHKGKFRPLSMDEIKARFQTKKPLTSKNVKK